MEQLLLVVCYIRGHCHAPNPPDRKIADKILRGAVKIDAYAIALSDPQGQEAHGDTVHFGAEKPV